MERQITTGKLLATQGYVIGVEISGSGSRQSVALADLDGNILYKARRPLEYVPDTQTVLRLLDEMLAEVTAPERLRDGRILRAGVAVGGLVDSSQGVVRTMHHAQGWDNFPLQDYLVEKLDVTCIIDNNANAAALAEVESGAASPSGEEGGHKKAERVVLYIGLGRGIGGGLVANGKIYHGTTCTAGEIGHMQVKEHGPKSSLGAFGHLEAIASAQAISRTMIGLSVEYPETEAAIRRVTGARAERITAEQVFQLAAGGDPIAQRVIEDVYTYLGIALANIVYLINPGLIVLGGQVALAGETFITPPPARPGQPALPPVWAAPRLPASKHWSEANIVRAVTLALQDG